tara:strand:+ start:245 stop:625 length:381 start_codon:yes stop_codon:yes gene_type:complete
MRTIVLALAAAMAATSVSAMDLPVAGLALNTEVVATYKVDAETTTLVATPELEYSYGSAAFTAGMELSVWDNANNFTLADEFDVKPEILLGATFLVRDDLELEAATSYNFETEQRSEVTLTATFAF